MKKSLHLIVLFCLLGTLQAFPQFQHKIRDEVSAFEKNREKAIGVQPYTEQTSLKPLTDVKLDSILSFNWDTTAHAWISWKKEFRTYNTSGFTTEVLFLISNNTGGWNNYQKHTTDYTETGTFTKDIWYGWNQVTSAWVITAYSELSEAGRLLYNYYYQYNIAGNLVLSGGRMNYVYDSIGYNTEIINQTWDTVSSSWINYDHSVNNYFSNHLIEHLDQTWNKDSSKWLNNYHELYTYDINNRQLDYTMAFWYNSLWQNVIKKTNIYDSLQSLKNIVQFQWNNNTMAWDTSGQYSFMYTQTGNLGGEYYLTYDTAVSGYDSNYMYSWQYYLNGSLDNQSGFYHNPLAGTWICNYYMHNDQAYHQLEYYSLYYDQSTYEFAGGNRMTAEYDTAGNRTLSQNQNWDTGIHGWDFSSQSLMTYDSTGLILQETDQVWGTNSHDWVNNILIKYYYARPAGVQEHQQPNCTCFFNNPMMQGEPIHCTSTDPNKNYRFALYSVTGSLVYSHDFRGNADWIFNSHLASGVYLMAITSDSKLVYSGKVIAL